MTVPPMKYSMINGIQEKGYKGTVLLFPKLLVMAKKELYGMLRIKDEMMGINPAILYKFAGFCIFVVNKNGIWKWVKDTKEPSLCILYSSHIKVQFKLAFGDYLKKLEQEEERGWYGYVVSLQKQGTGGFVSGNTL